METGISEACRQSAGAVGSLGGGGGGDADGPPPSFASRAAMRVRSTSFSSRARRAMSLTASNSSRLTRSRSRSHFSACVLNMVSTSRLMPCATPAASFIRRATSSKKRLLVWVMARLQRPRSLPQEWGRQGRKASLDPSVSLATINWQQTHRTATVCRLTSPARPACITPNRSRRPMPLNAIPFPNIDPVLVSVGPFAIRWYALAYIVGILGGWFYARAIVRSQKLWGGPAPLTVTDYDDFILWVTLGIILGGRIGYVLFYNAPYFVDHPAEIVQLWKGGMSFHGGFLGCVAAVLLFAWRRGIPWLSLGDITCAVAPIGLLLGRLANFINAELWGRVTDVPWAMVFPGAGPLPRHPSQLYEATLEGLVLLILLGLLLRAGALRRPGTIIGVFALGYGVARFICEFFREPDTQVGFLWGGLTMGMLLSLPLMLAGIAFLWAARRAKPVQAT